MPERDYHALEFEVPERPAHWFYITSNQAIYKVGHTTRPAKRPHELNRQLKGHRMGVFLECHCPLPAGPSGRPDCLHEMLWRNNFANDRIEWSEQYWRSKATDGQTHYYVMMPLNQLRGLAGKAGEAWLRWVLSVEVRRLA